MLNKILAYLHNFNTQSNITLSIDSIRIEFNKKSHLYKLEALGQWHKIDKSSKISSKLKKRLKKGETTSAYQLENYNIYFFNSQDKPLYRKATMVIFGLSQYDTKEIPLHLVDEILAILKNISNIDICFDFTHEPNIGRVEKHFTLTDYKNYHQTYYCNNPKIDLIEKFVIYNKAFKNNIAGILYRIEFKVIIENIKDLYLPLKQIQAIISLLNKEPYKPNYNNINAKGRNV